LTDKIISVVLASERRSFLNAALALRSGLHEPVVHSLISSHNATTMTAFAWKARLNMASALQLQLRLGVLTTSNAIRPDPNGRFPLLDDDKVWKIDLVR
jgi:uncharacterized membrane protein